MVVSPPMGLAMVAGLLNAMLGPALPLVAKVGAFLIAVSLMKQATVEWAAALRVKRLVIARWWCGFLHRCLLMLVRVELMVAGPITMLLVVPLLNALQEMVSPLGPLMDPMCRVMKLLSACVVPRLARLLLVPVVLTFPRVDLNRLVPPTVVPILLTLAMREVVPLTVRVLLDLMVFPTFLVRLPSEVSPLPRPTWPFPQRTVRPTCVTSLCDPVSLPVAFGLLDLFLLVLLLPLSVVSAPSLLWTLASMFRMLLSAVVLLLFLLPWVPDLTTLVRLPVGMSMMEILNRLRVCSLPVPALLLSLMGVLLRMLQVKSTPESSFLVSSLWMCRVPGELLNVVAASSLCLLLMSLVALTPQLGLLTPRLQSIGMGCFELVYVPSALVNVFPVTMLLQVLGLWLNAVVQLMNLLPLELLAVPVAKLPNSTGFFTWPTLDALWYEEGCFCGWFQWLSRPFCSAKSRVDAKSGSWMVAAFSSLADEDTPESTESAIASIRELFRSKRGDARAANYLLEYASVSSVVECESICAYCAEEKVSVSWS